MRHNSEYAGDRNVMLVYVMITMIMFLSSWGRPLRTGSSASSRLAGGVDRKQGAGRVAVPGVGGVRLHAAAGCISDVLRGCQESLKNEKLVDLMPREAL